MQGYEGVCMCLWLCIYRARLLPALPAELVPLGADVALRFLQGGRRRPARRGPGHIVDEVDLEAVGHAVEGLVLPPHTDGAHAGKERTPPCVALVAHCRLFRAVSLRMQRDSVGTLQ